MRLKNNMNHIPKYIAECTCVRCILDFVFCSRIVLVGWWVCKMWIIYISVSDAGLCLWNASIFMRVSIRKNARYLNTFLWKGHQNRNKFHTHGSPSWILINSNSFTKSVCGWNHKDGFVWKWVFSLYCLDNTYLHGMHLSHDAPYMLLTCGDEVTRGSLYVTHCIERTSVVTGLC